jgi:hypothetical protein
MKVDGETVLDLVVQLNQKVNGIVIFMVYHQEIPQETLLLIIRNGQDRKS